MKVENLQTKHKDKSANETAKHQKQKLMDDTEVNAHVTATKNCAHGVRTYTHTLVAHWVKLYFKDLDILVSSCTCLL